MYETTKKRLGDILLRNEIIRDDYLYLKYGNNIYDLNLTDTIEKGIVEKLMGARILGIKYCVVYHGIVMSRHPHPYSPYFISTDDIQITKRALTEDDDEIKKIEKANIYWFLQGKVPVKSKEEYYKRKKEEELAAMQEKQPEIQETKMVK